MVENPKSGKTVTKMLVGIVKRRSLSVPETAKISLIARKEMIAVTRLISHKQF